MSVTPEVVENRRRWVERLERDEDDQTTTTLHRKDGSYCCLGIACEESGLGHWSGDTQEGYLLPGESFSTTYLLDPPILGHFGLPDRSGLQSRLAQMNDAGTSFPEIAALLRSDEWFGPELDREMA